MCTLELVNRKLFLFTTTLLPLEPQMHESRDPLRSKKTRISHYFVHRHVSASCTLSFICIVLSFYVHLYYILVHGRTSSQHVCTSGLHTYVHLHVSRLYTIYHLSWIPLESTNPRNPPNPEQQPHAACTKSLARVRHVTHARGML